MRTPKWTTLRWRFPRMQRQARFSELVAKKEFKDIFDKDFLSGLERRKDLLDSRFLKLIAIQVPIFLFLAFSLLSIDAKITLFGVSAESTKSLREVLLVMSTALGFMLSDINADIRFLKETLKAAANMRAGSNGYAKQFLELRYGVGTPSQFDSFEKDLHAGTYQFVLGGIWVICAFALVLMIVAMALSLQVLTLVEVYRAPNFSFNVSMFVIVFVLLGDLMALVTWLLTVSFQPYQTFEDFNKLSKLRERNPEGWNAEIKRIVQAHVRKGFLRRLFTRPKLHPIK